LPLIASGDGDGYTQRAWQGARSAGTQGAITLADGTVVASPKLTHPRAGLSHVEKIERQLGLSLDQMAEIISRPWEELDAAWIAIKTRVLCVFRAIGAKMIRARADDTLDFAAACRRAREREPRDFDEFVPKLARREGAGPLGWRACLYGGKPGRPRWAAAKKWAALANSSRFLGVTAPQMRHCPRSR
jgi:hypothetical protein